MPHVQDLAGKVVLVTGASRGIGYQAAREAARRGAHVIAVARTVGGLEDLDDDIQELGGSDDAGAARSARRRGHRPARRLDLRALGPRSTGWWATPAQLGVITPLAHLDPPDFEKTFGLNVTANYRLIRSLDPAAAPCRGGSRGVPVVGRGARRHGRSGGSTRASKAALETMVKQLCRRDRRSTPRQGQRLLSGRGAHADARQSHPGEDPETLPHPSAAAPELIDMIVPGYSQNGDELQLLERKQTVAL